MLPIDAALPELLAALSGRTAVVLVAPPGAGKTTRVPLALLDQPWLASQRLILLEPRRIAARAAAARMAATLGESVGDTVGLRVRMESRVSVRTRIEVVTEGVFARMIQGDPALDGVGAVLFDEFHERSLDADLGLALALDAQRVLRDDLRLLVMSATLDDARIAAVLGEAPVIRSEGRAHSVESRYLGRDAAIRIEDQMAAAVRRALAEECGSVLAFLPGQAEIRRTAERLDGRLPADVDLDPLYGALTQAEQDRAIRPPTAGRRKVVLATAVAQTSLTIEGVRVVVDSGLSRVPRYDPGRGLTRLETVRVSRASADQRRGRAGRTEPGVCYRLWDEAETRSLSPHDEPEMLQADLSGLALDLARWGAPAGEGLTFIDPPPARAFGEARTLLARLGAVGAEGRLTEEGAAMARLPLPPRLAHMVRIGARGGVAERAAMLAVLLSERGLGGDDADVSQRLRQLQRDGSPRARDAKALAGRIARMTDAGGDGDAPSDGLLIASAFPERVAQARSGPGEYRLASGRGARLDPTDALAREPWLAVAELGGGQAHDRILAAARLDLADLEAAFADRILADVSVEQDAAGRVQVMERRRLGALVLGERRIERPEPALVEAALLQRLRRDGLGGLAMDAVAPLRARVAFVRALEPDAWPDLSDAGLMERLDAWAPPLLSGRRSLAEVEAHRVRDAIADLFPWDQRRRLDALAPERFSTPAGTTAEIDYAAEGGPRAEVRVQALVGLDRHPAVADGRVPLTLALLSPASRPVALTADLPGFWRGGWADVRRDLRGRYPRHPWPEDPLAAAPTTRAKPRGS